jgi:hypothetical protein
MDPPRDRRVAPPPHGPVAAVEACLNSDEVPPEWEHYVSLNADYFASD